MAECEITKQSQRSRRRIALEYAGVCAAALVLYAVSCAPGALWQDSGMIQYRVWHNDIEGKLGLALAHPLYYVVAIGVKYLGIGSFFHRVNLISSAAGAVAVANVYLLVRLWLGKVWPAAVAAISLALSHTFWQHASIAETYTMYAALLLGELIVLLQYTRTRKVGWLYGLALTNGLAIAVHMLASIPLACYAVFVAVLWVRKEIHPRQVALCALLWVVGAAAYEYLIIKQAVETGDIAGTLASAAFGGKYKADVLNLTMSWGIVKENLLFILLNFPTPNILFGAVGIFGLWRLAPRTGFGVVIVCLLALFFVFAFRYTIVDRYAFFIPFYVMFSIMLGLGAHLVMEKKQCRKLAVLVLLLALLPVPAYAVAPEAARGYYPLLGERRQIPYRDNYAYFLRPWQTGYYGADRFAEEALASVPADAVVYADSTTAYPLLCAQEIHGVREDVEVVMQMDVADADRIARLVSQKTLYVVSPVAGYCPGLILHEYDLVGAGVLWRVVEKRQLPDVRG
jgi:hypothetical protein